MVKIDTLSITQNPMDKHPKYISEKLHTINENQFGYDAGLQDSNKILLKNHLKGLREIYINHLLLKKYSLKIITLAKNFILNYHKMFLNCNYYDYIFCISRDRIQ